MCGRTHPIKRFIPPDGINLNNLPNKEKLLVKCKRCNLPYGEHHIEAEKIVLVRSCDDNAPNI
jgi:hypothetical protein